MLTVPIDPTRDLVLTRELALSRDLIWKAWTTPEYLKEWFAPKPWSVATCRIDLKPGGEFLAEMADPDGKVMEGPAGCILEVEPLKRLTWTDSLGPGFRPNPDGFFTAMLTLEDLPSGTKYTVVAMHKDSEQRKNHEEMGFAQGWSTMVDQLVAFMATV